LIGFAEAGECHGSSQKKEEKKCPMTGRTLNIEVLYK
jgi:hypothetical protein